MFDFCVSNIMETITKIPGLQHIFEDIFGLLDKKILMYCGLVNKTWMRILNQPIFWLKKLKMTTATNDPENVHKSWELLAEKLDDDHLVKEFVLILTKIYETDPISPLGITVALKKARKCRKLMKFIIVKVDPYCSVDLKYKVDGRGYQGTGFTPIHIAAFFGLTEVVEEIAVNYSTPMVRCVLGINPLHMAALKGHLDIVKFLVRYFPDSQNDAGLRNRGTPIFFAAKKGQIETVKFLKNLTKTPNAPNHLGFTAAKIARRFNHNEIAELLEK